MALRFLLYALCIAHCALFAGGCAKAQAKANVEGPPLAVPAPPPRVLAPVEETLTEDVPPAPEQPATPPAGSGRTTTARPQTPNPRRPPTTTAATPSATTEPAPDAAPTPAAPPAAEPPVVRPVPTQDTAAENRVREVMRKAAADLKGVDYRKLSAAGQGQYQQSQKFYDEADRALKERNYTLAATLADKAAIVASELLAVTR